MKNEDVSMVKWYKTDRRQVARKRWALLAEALFSKCKQSAAADSNFFDIFKIIPLPNLSSLDDRWFEYSVIIDHDHDPVSVKIRHLVRIFTIEELTGFNNTGNVKVWPSEEVLAYVCLKHRHFFEDKSVLEVGGGMSCMAGVLLSQLAKCASIHVTDGNVVSVDNVREIVKQNVPAKCPLTCDVLLWHEHGKHCRTYDVILAADCLFFEDSRAHLIELMFALLKNGGISLIMAPKRGDSLAKFVEQCRAKGFVCNIHQEYDEIIWSQHTKLSKERRDYDEDVHFPLFLVLEKRKPSVPSTLENTLWSS